MTTTAAKFFPHLGRVTGVQASHVLWHFGEEGGIEPGDFTRKLLDLFEAADPDNLAVLAGSFPEYAAAWRLGKQWESGIAVLREIAQGPDRG